MNWMLNAIILYHRRLIHLRSAQKDPPVPLSPELTTTITYPPASYASTHVSIKALPGRVVMKLLCRGCDGKDGDVGGHSVFTVSRATMSGAVVMEAAVRGGYM